MNRRKFFQFTAAGSVIGAARSGPVAVICLETGEDKADDQAYLFGRVACEPMRREEADGKPLVLNVTDLDGDVTRDHSFSPLG